MTSSLSGLDRPQRGYTRISLCNVPTGLQVLAGAGSKPVLLQGLCHAPDKC